jgi:pilus assembly protein FimV
LKINAIVALQGSGGAAMKLRLITAMSGLLCLVASLTAYGLAISELDLQSKLNQPLIARIRLISLSQAELDSLIITVQGGEGSALPAGGLQQEVQQDENGHYIVISSKEPVREPVMTLVLELKWSTGHLTRQYELIIDPS